MKGQLVADIRKAVKDEMGSALDGQQELLNQRFETLRASAPTPAVDAQANTAFIKVNLQHSDACRMSLVAGGYTRKSCRRLSFNPIILSQCLKLPISALQSFIKSSARS